MIHDAQVEVSCDGERCTESVYVGLPYVYATLSGSGGRYDADDSDIEYKLKTEHGWVVMDGKHYCGMCADDPTEAP